MGDEPPLDRFLATLGRSRVFDAADIDRLAARLRPVSARAFADSLIRAGELTRYQADKLLRGKWQGLVLGPYGVLTPLGRGGMGTVVYLARDRRVTESLGDTELLALKLLPDRKAVEDPKVLARFRREMDLGRRVHHPNVVRTFAAGEVDDVHFLALEYVPGKTLRQVVEERGPLAVGDAARVFVDVAAGLAHVHERGLVHRDVKPGNMMLRPDGRAVVLDLGLALALGEQLPDDPAIAGGRGYVVGTMDYLAPEQATNAAAVGPAADLYGLGCSLFYALTGTPPFPAEGAKDKVRRHRDDPPPPVSSVPPEFEQLVHALMAKSVGDRPVSAIQVRELLSPWVIATPTTVGTNGVDAVDEPGLDAGLWDAAPGEELPGEERQRAVPVPFARLADADRRTAAGMPDDTTGAVSHRASWLLVGLLLSLMALVMLVAVLRRL